MSAINKVAVHEAGHAIMLIRYGYNVPFIETNYDSDSDEGTGQVCGILSTMNQSECVSTPRDWEKWKTDAIRDLLETAGGPLAEAMFENVVDCEEQLNAECFDWNRVGGDNDETHMFQVVARWKRISNGIPFGINGDDVFKREVSDGVSLILQHVHEELDDEQTWATLVELAALLSCRNGERVECDTWDSLPRMQEFISRFPNYRDAPLPGDLIHRLCAQTGSEVARG